MSGLYPSPTFQGINVLDNLTVAPASFPLTNSAAGTMGVAAAIIVPASGTRKWVMITNRTASDTQDIGSSNVTVGAGIPLSPGGGFLFNGAGASGPIYGISTAAASAFSYVEG